MKKYKSHTLTEYIKAVAGKNPTPGGGSVAALTGALGVSLISMVANYSRNRGLPSADEKKIVAIYQKSEKLRKRLLELVDLDAQAYLKVVKTRKSSLKIKRAALKQAQRVPLEVCGLCYKAIDLTPFLVRKGNQHLLSDVEVAVELLLAAFKSAMINVKVNQV